MLLNRFDSFVAAQPDAPALRVQGDAGLEQLSYAELNALANTLANALSDTGPNSLVAIRLPAGKHQIAAILATWKTGNAYLPLASSPEREAQIIREAKPAVVLDEQFVAVATGSAVYESVEQNPDALAYVMFTSGSTGTPKGVAVSQQNIAGLFDPLTADLDIAPSDVWLQQHSFGFGFSVWEIWGALSTGGCLSITDEANRRDPQRVAALVEQAGVSVLNLTPSGFAQWLAVDRATLPESLRLIVLSGEAVVPDHLNIWFAGHPDSNVRIINTYALTETAGRVCVEEFRAGEPVDASVIGTPVSDFDVFIVDEDLQPAEEGELLVAGAGVAPGYFNDKALTDEKFVVFNGKRCYRSGDRVRQLADGRLEYLGRVDAQIKLYGYRIEPAEIENSLRQHPDVLDAAVDVVEGTNGEPQLAVWYQAAAADDSAPEFWPSLGEYQIYDELLYDFMTADEVRVAAYRRAFEKVAAGKVVLDIGTGQDALLARLAYAAGARKVYAVEVIPEAAERARKLVDELGCAPDADGSGGIEVICGDMQEIALPEAIDVCTQGIIGNIGSSDGIIPIWNSAAGLFAEDYQAVPSSCNTRIAAVELPPELKPEFSSLAAGYTETIFAEAGRRFDIRMCVRNFPDSAKLTNAAMFEEIDFQKSLQADESGQLDLSVRQAGRFDGLLLWTEVETLPGDVVDFLDHQQAWLPVYIPVTDDMIQLKAGDQLSIAWQRVTGADGVFPDYSFSIVVNSDGVRRELPEYITRHHEDAFNRNDFYRSLHASLETEPEAVSSIQAWLAERLPEYMRPSVWTQVAALPLTANGKLDRSALPQPQVKAVVYRAPETPLQQDLAEIWQNLLGVERVGLGQDFFDVGGDSISAVRLTTEIQRLLDDTVFLAAVFGAPEIAALAEYLEREHAEAVARRYGAEDAAAIAIDEVRPRADSNAPAPLSYAQQSLWFLNRLYPDSTAANEQFAIRLQGAVDTTRLNEAWQQLLQRHAILHTRFEMHGEEPVQVIDPELIATYAIEPSDSSLAECAQQEIATIFDLSNGPLLRARLLTETGSSVLLITVHHILADGLSVEIIRDELAALYEGAAAGVPELQFADFADWQRNLPFDQLAEQTAYWQQQLRGADYLLDLPLASTRVSRSLQESRAEFFVDAPDLRGLAKQQGTSVFVALMAALRVSLSRLTSQTDFLIGSPVTLRQSGELQQMIGCMINNMAFRNPLTAGESFVDVLAGEQAALLGALDNTAAPFEQVVETLDPPREFGRHPLFQTLLMYEDRTALPVVADGVEFAVDVPHPLRPSYWDVEVTALDFGDAQPMRIVLSLHPDRFDRTIADALASTFERVLQAVITEPATPADHICIADAPAYDPPEPIVIYDSDTIIGHFTHQVTTRPHATALISDSGELSYSDLNRQANVLARRLVDSGLEPEARVGIHVQRSAERVVCLLALQKAGLVAVPLEPAWPSQRLQYMGQQADLSLLLTESAADFGCEQWLLSDINFGGDADDVLVRTDPDGPLWVLFTSGSTGKPKGVLYSQSAALHRIRWMWDAFGYGPDDRFVHRTSMNFVDSWWEVFGPLTHGAAVVLPSPHADRDPSLLLQAITKHSATHLVAVPSLLSVLLEVSAQSGADLSSVKSLICSGEALAPDLLAKVRHVLPGIRLLNTYGTTETWDITVAITDDIHTPCSDASVGIEVPCVGAYVLDENRQPVPHGVWGELYVGGESLPLAYVGDAGATELLTRVELFGYRTSLYATGDRARRCANGEFELGGRTDRQIKLRGVRIDPVEVESQVRNYPGVSEAAVAERIDDNDEPRLVAWVVAADASDSRSLQDFLRGWLPDAMVPDFYVYLDALPLTPSGKIDYLNLPVPHWPDAAVESVGYVEPETETEKQLAVMWSDILGVDQVGRNDDFFALRGHSLMAARLMSRVCDAFNTDLPLQCLFENPALKDLAASIDTIRGVLEDSEPEASGEGREVLRF